MVMMLIMQTLMLTIITIAVIDAFDSILFRSSQWAPCHTSLHSSYNITHISLEIIEKLP